MNVVAAKAGALAGLVEKAEITLYTKIDKTEFQVKGRIPGEMETQIRIDRIRPDFKLKLPFNPNRIRYLSSAEKLVQSSLRQGRMEMKDTRYNQVAKPITGQMSFQLVFDRMEIAQCFMWEGLQTITNPSLTTVTKNLTSLVKGAVSGPPSVMDVMCGFSAALMSGVEAIGFRWGNINFVGTLTEVQMVFTMFSTKGEPVRGTIDMRLLETEYQRAGIAKSDPFEKLFKDNIADARNVSQKVGNLANLNL